MQVLRTVDYSYLQREARPPSSDSDGAVVELAFCSFDHRFSFLVRRTLSDIVPWDEYGNETHIQRRQLERIQTPHEICVRDLRKAV